MTTTMNYHENNGIKRVWNFSKRFLMKRRVWYKASSHERSERVLASF